MSLPSFIDTNNDSLFSHENLIQDLNTTFLLSLKDSTGLSEKTTNINLRDDSLLTPIESYGSFVDFDPETRQKISKESELSMFEKTANVCRVLRNSNLEYHMRNSVQFSTMSSEKLFHPVCVRSGF
jgi:hypothetical protein